MKSKIENPPQGGAPKSKIGLALLAFGFWLLFLLAPDTWHLTPPLHAAVQVEVVPFTYNTGGSTTTINTTFQWKAVILCTWGKTAEGESAGASWSCGFSSSVYEYRIAWAGDDAVATTNTGRGHQTDRALNVYTNGTPTLGTNSGVSGVAFNASTTVLTHTGTPSTAWKGLAIGLGGTTITNAAVFEGTWPTSPGTATVSGIGFQGDFVILFNTRQSSFSGSDAAMTAGSVGMGVATASEQWCISAAARDAQTTSGAVDAESRVRDNRIWLEHSLPSGGTANATFTAFNSDGFTMEVNSAPTTAWIFTGLIIKGGIWKAGVNAKPTGASTQTFTTTGLTPKLLATVLTSATALDTLTSNAITTFGATDGTTSAYAGAYHNDAINTVAKSSGSSTALSHEMNATADATFNAFDAEDAKIDWSASGTAYLVPWFAVGEASAASSKLTITGAGSISGAGTIQ